MSKSHVDELIDNKVAELQARGIDITYDSATGYRFITRDGQSDLGVELANAIAALTWLNGFEAGVNAAMATLFVPAPGPPPAPAPVVVTPRPGPSPTRLRTTKRLAAELMAKQRSGK